MSLDITAPSGKIISDDNTYSGSGNMLALVYNKEVEGRVTIRNCTFVNGYHFAIEMGCVAGHFDIYNNVFVANRMSACEVRVYDNIFGCSNLGAIERTFVDSNSAKEAARITSATDNLFFMNRNNMTDGAADLVLPSGGGKWLFLAASQFEDAEQLKEYEGNREMAADENFINAIDPAYLKGYMGINIKSSSSYDPNSAANRYPFEKAFELFGAVSGCGAQRP